MLAGSANRTRRVGTFTNAFQRDMIYHAICHAPGQSPDHAPGAKPIMRGIFTDSHDGSTYDAACYFADEHMHASDYIQVELVVIEGSAAVATPIARSADVPCPR